MTARVQLEQWNSGPRLLGGAPARRGAIVSPPCPSSEPRLPSGAGGALGTGAEQPGRDAWGPQGGGVGAGRWAQTL